MVQAKSAGFKAGVQDYRLTYYTPDYTPKDTDILACFRFSPQPGVPPKKRQQQLQPSLLLEPGQRFGQTGLTDLDRYKGRCYDLEPFLTKIINILPYIAYPLDLFEEGSVTNILTSLVGNVFGFKALRALRLEDIRIPVAYLKTFQGPPHGIPLNATN